MFIFGFSCKISGYCTFGQIDYFLQKRSLAKVNSIHFIEEKTEIEAVNGSF